MILVTNNEGTVGVPTTARLLARGAPALDAIEAGIRLIEADPRPHRRPRRLAQPARASWNSTPASWTARRCAPARLAR